jgi:hypothetical protein
MGADQVLASIFLLEPETYLLTACGIPTTPLAERAAASDAGDFSTVSIA